MTSRLDPNDAKAVLGVLVGDALDQPRQNFSIGWMGLRLHDARRPKAALQSLLHLAIHLVAGRIKAILQLAPLTHVPDTFLVGHERDPADQPRLSIPGRAVVR